MTFRDLVWDTVRTIWAHKLRTALTMFGIAWSIISMLMLVGLLSGLIPAIKASRLDPTEALRSE